ncbi:hypothetical protein QEN19_004057 [Hanseniaspora menglaensis]
MGENISFKNVPFRTNKKKNGKNKKKVLKNPHMMSFKERNGSVSSTDTGDLKIKNTSTKKQKNKTKNDTHVEAKQKQFSDTVTVVPSSSSSSKKGMKARKNKKLKLASFTNESHPERMRKSSFNRVTKNFAVFNDNELHEEKYSDLSRDVTPQISNSNFDNSTSSQDDEIIFDLEDLVSDDDTKEASDAAKPKIVTLTSSDDDEYDPIKETEKVQDDDFESEKEEVNGLAGNNDFIQFESEEESEEEDDEDDDIYSPKALPAVSEYPWLALSKKKVSEDDDYEIASQLSIEIESFVKYISPSKEEILKRNKALTRLCEAVTQLWPDSQLLPFGSYATDLYLPQSDIDCCVISEGKNKNSKSFLYELASFLKYKKLAIRVEVIASARIPIIKFVEAESGIHFDVCFEQDSGITVAKMVSSWIHEVKGLRELVLVVKQFLSSRKLNNVRFGGLGGFSMVCLCYSFLKLHPKISGKCMDPLENLGTLLIEFFELYGIHFNYEAVGISLLDESFGYLTKRAHPELSFSRAPRRGPPDNYTLIIQNPLSPNENITAGTFRLRWITKAFFGAYQLLCERCYELNKLSKKNRMILSILGVIIKYKGHEREFSDDRGDVTNEASLRVHKFVDDKLKKEQSEEFDPRVYHMTDSENEEDLYVIPKPAYGKKRAAPIDRENKFTKKQKVSDLLGLDE